MLKPVFISCQPSKDFYVWQIEVQLYNLRKFGYSEGYNILVYLKPGERVSDNWRKLENLFPEAKFFYYRDSSREAYSVIKSIDYEPYLRLWMLEKHFKNNPDLEKEAIFYLDCDVLFTKHLNFSKFLIDDINYISWPGSDYLGPEYFDSKIKDVHPSKLEAYKSLDVLDMTARLCGIDRAVVESNKEFTGGAQYLLKNIDHIFWKECRANCRKIRVFLKEVINKGYFESENKGFQSWCADMWALLWTLWKNNKKTSCPEELNFTWATDPIDKLDHNYMFHNAGVSSEVMKYGPKDFKLFYKNRYTRNFKIPIKDLSYIDSLDKGFAVDFYVESILKTKEFSVFS